MNITRTIKLDLAKQDSPVQLGYLAVAGDSTCRSLDLPDEGLQQRTEPL